MASNRDVHPLDPSVETFDIFTVPGSASSDQSQAVTPSQPQADQEGDSVGGSWCAVDGGVAMHLRGSVPGSASADQPQAAAQPQAAGRPQAAA